MVEFTAEEVGRNPDGTVTRAVGYVRTEVDGGGFSVSAQEQHIANRCDEKGYLLVGIYQDLGQAANEKFNKRVGLASAINALATKQATVLLAVDQARIATNPLDGVFIETMATERAGAHLETADDIPVNWGMEASTVRGLLSTFIDAQTAFDDAMQEAEDNDDELAIQHAKNFHRKGMSLRKIAEELERRGHLSRAQTRLSPEAIRRMLDKETPQEQERRQRGLQDSGLLVSQR